MLRTFVLCLVLPGCVDEEPPDVPDHDAIFTIKAPASFDTLTLILPDGRQTVAVDPPSSVYVWDDLTFSLPDTMQVVASRAGATVAYADESFTYAYDQTPNGMFTIELHP